MSRVSQEVARALTNDLEPRYTKPSFASELVNVAKKLERAQNRRRRLRALVMNETRTILRYKKELRALSSAMQRGE